MFKVFILVSFISISNVFAGQISGGISGGGGEILPENPIGNYSIESMLREAKAVAYYYFSTTKRQPISVKTYAPIFEIIKNTNIAIQSTGPCYDSHGVAMDGSVYSDIPNTICISSYQLGKKLSESNAWLQTMALVIHEYSHLIGTTEEQADEIQKQAIYQLNSKALLPLRSTTDIFNVFFDEWNSFQQRIPNLKELKTDDDYRALSAFLNIGSGLSVDDTYNNHLIHSDFIFSVMSIDDHNLVRTLLTKLKIIQIGVDLSFDQEIRNKYYDIFGDKNEMKLKDFMKEFDPAGEYNEGFSKKFDYVKGITIIKINKYNHAEFRNNVVASLNSLKSDFYIVYKNIKNTYVKLLDINI